MDDLFMTVCFKEVTRCPTGGCFREFRRVFQERFKGDSSAFQASFKIGSRMVQRCFTEGSRVCKACFKEVSCTTNRSYPSRRKLDFNCQNPNLTSTQPPDNLNCSWV